MLVGKIPGVLAVQEDAAGSVVLAGEQVAEVILVVRSLHDGVIDVGAVYDEPTHHIGIDGPQRVKIHLGKNRPCLLHRFFWNAGSRLAFLWWLRWQRNFWQTHISRQILIGPHALCVLLERHIHLPGTDGSYRHQSQNFMPSSFSGGMWQWSVKQQVLPWSLPLCILFNKTSISVYLISLVILQ